MTAQLTFWIGAFFAVFLLSRLTLLLVKADQRHRFSRLAFAHGLSLVISVLLYGFGSGEGGFGARMANMFGPGIVRGIYGYGFPQAVLLLAEYFWRERQQKRAFWREFEQRHMPEVSQSETLDDGASFAAAEVVEGGGMKWWGWVVIAIGGPIIWAGASAVVVQGDALIPVWGGGFIAIWASCIVIPLVLKALRKDA